MSDFPMELKTYRELLAFMENMTEQQLDQPVQVVLPSGDLDKAVELQPGIAIGTVAQMEFYKARSSVDNKYHADEVVLLIDGNPFSVEGAVAYSLSDADDWDDMKNHPIYGDGGPTNPADQCSGRQPNVEDIQASVVATVNNRSRNFRTRNGE